MTTPLSRRRALAGAAGVGVGAPLLAACGDDGSAPSSKAGTTPTTPAQSPSVPTSSAPASPATSEAPAAGGLVAVADVPVGGGIILGSEEVVVTQPTAGEFKAFSAICTHQGCLVGSVADGQIVCPCHGSTFALTDGAVLGGQASAPLPPVAVRVDGDRVVKA